MSTAKSWFHSQVGKAEDCNSSIVGSSPAGTSIALVAKLVDARDLKSRGLQTPCRFDSGPGHHLWFCGCSSMVELQPSKLTTWVRFPSPAPITVNKHNSLQLFFLYFYPLLNRKSCNTLVLQLYLCLFA